MKRPQILAFYLPQYYPFKENNEWWGEGFTEWTNVGRAKPLFKGHYQPKVPADLGYYDLRLPIVREQQTKLAKKYGIDGFCYWHYWFGNGKRLLDLVENEVVETGQPDFPFCYCWANHSWLAKNWNIKDSKFGHRTLIEQEYPGVDDYTAHFYSCLKAFKDSRYIKNGNKPIFGIYDAQSIPDVKVFISLWNELARQNGFDGIYFMCFCITTQYYEKVKTLPFNEFIVDTLNLCEKPMAKWKERLRRAISILMMDGLIRLRVKDYSDYTKSAVSYYESNSNVTICAVPNYDHSPRSGNYALVLNNATPQKFESFLIKIKKILSNRSVNNRFLFLKSWNEWGEGNYLEPDLKYRKGFLESIKKVFGTM